MFHFHKNQFVVIKSTKVKMKRKTKCGVDILYNFFKNTIAALQQNVCLNTQCCYVNPPCNFCSCSCRFTASCASFCIASSFSSVTDFMGIILGLQRTGIGACSVKRSPCFGRTSLKTSLSPAMLAQGRLLSSEQPLTKISEK